MDKAAATIVIKEIMVVCKSLYNSYVIEIYVDLHKNFLPWFSRPN